MSDLDDYIAAKGDLVIAGGVFAVANEAHEMLNGRLNELRVLESALALCPKASSATLDWLAARIADAEAEQSAMTEIVDMLAAFKADDAAAATAAVAATP